MEAMMKRLIKRNGRTILAGMGMCLASLTGCQSAGPQFASPWAARQYDQPNAIAGMMPTSPAFSRVQAGQNLPVMQQGMMTQQGMMPQQQMMAGPGYPQGMMPQQQMMAQQPVMGSGGMVYPVGYQQGGQPMMAGPGQVMPNQPMMNQQGMTYIPQPGPATVYTPAAPVTQAPPVTPAPQPGVTVTQGPNGPITVTTEIFEQPPTTPGQPGQVNFTPVMPAGQPAQVTMPAPSGPVMPAGQPSSLPAPTFNVPVPYTVPLPEAPNLPSVGRPPEMLPNTVGKTPTGPSLPGFNFNAPAGLGNYPAVPVGHQQVAPPPALKLPPPGAPAGPTAPDDDISSAPIFLPGK